MCGDGEKRTQDGDGCDTRLWSMWACQISVGGFWERLARADDSYGEFP